MSKKKQMDRKGGSSTKAMTDYMDFKGRKMDMKSIMKDIEFLGSSHMTWKEKKDLENRKVVALGGKPPKNQRLPLSVARVTMKKQKERDQKLQEERLILGRFGGMLGGGSKKVAKKRRPEDSVLKSTEGYFRNGVLNVKSLMTPAGTGELDRSMNTLSVGFDNIGKKKGGFKKKGKKKGGGKKRR